MLVVTKADLGEIATRTRRDLSAALRSLGSSSHARARRLLAVSAAAASRSSWRRSPSTAPALDLPARRLRARRAGALTDFAVEHGERGLRALGGRRAAERAARRAQEPRRSSVGRRSLDACSSEALGGRLRMARDLAMMFGAFVLASALAGALGAANLGTALAFGQIAFAATTVYVMLRR